MNVKRIFGIILTVLGIVALIYFATLFINSSGTGKQIKVLVVYGLLGAIFFFTGISLIRTTRDDARPPID
jgi:predicted Na+-dependent transporter